MRKLEREIEDPDTPLPLLVVELGRLPIDQLQSCNTKIAVVERQMKEEAKRDPEALLLQTAPGIGPVSAMAIKAFGPDMNSFRRGGDFAAWLGLVPLQKSTGGKQKTWSYFENGTTRHPPPTNHWGNDPLSMGDQEWSP